MINVIAKNKSIETETKFNFGLNFLFDIASATHAANIISANIQKNTVLGTTKGKKNSDETIRGTNKEAYAPHLITCNKNNARLEP